MINRLVIPVVVILFVLSCKKDKPEESENQFSSNAVASVLVGNEGNFQFGNASITKYSLEDSTVTENVFKEINGEAIGDVVQSMVTFGEKTFIVVNNSSKIEVVSKSTLKSTGTIYGLSSPRYILPVSSAKAYVTDLYSGTVSVVDLTTETVTKQIPVNGWTEELITLYGKVFVCNKGGKMLYVIDAQTDLLEDSIQLSSGPSSVVQDKNANLWVLCEGDVNGVGATLYQINPITLTILKVLKIPMNEGVGTLCVNPTNDTLYYLNKGVFQVPITSEAIPTSSFIASGLSNYYGLAVDPATGNLFVSDAFDFIQKSKITIFDPAGEEKRFFYSGVNSGSFLFN